MNQPANSRHQPSDLEPTATLRRRRPAVSCIECRRRKVACDRGTPCSSCAMRKSTCRYRRPPVNPSSPVAPPTVLPTPSTVEHCDTAPSLPPTRHLEEGTSSAPQRADRDHGAPNRISAITRHTSLQTNCRFTKGRVFGQSHWMNKLHCFVDIHRISHGCYFDDTLDVYKLQDRCKRLGRSLKGPHTLEPANRHIGDIDIKTLLTSRAVCDQILALYFRTFNSIYGVLHKPTFTQELDAYWNKASAGNEMFLSKLLLTLSIGATLYSGPDAKSIRNALSVAASDVVLTRQIWQCVPATKHALTEDTLQVSLLSLIARQCGSVPVGGDDVWITVGSLLRTAMVMGFHRDPIHLGHVSIFRGEMRRRLWYGIVEILVQSSLDNGHSPMLAAEEWDTAVPANVDDEDIAEDMISLPVSRPLDQSWTRSTAQCALARSLPLRLQIAKNLNDIQSELSYEQTLEMSKRLNDECLANSKLAGLCRRSCLDLDELRQNLLQLKLVDTLTRRFLLSLHTPFAHKSPQDPAFYFSRHICLESALKIWTYTAPARLPSPPSPHLNPMNDGLQQSSTSTTQDEYGLLKLRSRGTFRSIFYDSTTTVCLELTQRLLEDPSSAFSGYLHGPQLMPPMLKELHQMVKDAVEAQRGRIWEGETNIKGFIFFTSALAQADAMIRHGGKGGIHGDFDEDRIEQDLLKAQQKGFEEALRILQSLAAEKEAADVGGGRDGTLRTKSSGNDVQSVQPVTEGIRDESFSDPSAPNEEEPLEPLFQRSSELSGDVLGPWFYMDFDGEGLT